MKRLFFILLLLTLYPQPARAQVLIASWYSVDSLKAEGTYKYSKGVMSNGKLFKDEAFTCATRDFKLGETLKITSVTSGKSVICKVTDRISKRFKGERIDLSKGSFNKIADCKQGIVKVTVEVVRWVNSGCQRKNMN